MLLLFIVGSIVLSYLVIRELIGTEVMPLSCAHCHFGGDEDIAGQPRRWYTDHGDHVNCRHCGTRFKEHPNGTLVEDPS